MMDVGKVEKDILAVRFGRKTISTFTTLHPLAGLQGLPMQVFARDQYRTVRSTHHPPRHF